MARPMKDVHTLEFGDGQFSSESGPQHVFNAPGTYDITLSVTRISGLIRTRTIENLVTIHPNPEADFTWDVPSTATLDPRSRCGTGAVTASVLWVMDGDRPRRGFREFAFPRVGEHRVQLVASSLNGCQSVADHVLEVAADSASEPQRGSARMDGRTTLSAEVANRAASFVFRIEDGDGHIVFETTVPKAWDGSFLATNGTARPEFAWTAVIREVGPSYLR